MATTSSQIPQNIVTFCKEVGKLAERHGLSAVDLTIRNGAFHCGASSNEVTASWTAGRHGEDAHIIRISSTIRIVEDIRQPAEPPLPAGHPAAGLHLGSILNSIP